MRSHRHGRWPSRARCVAARGSPAAVVTTTTSGGGRAAASRPIKIGGIFDLTGATADVGTPYSEGMRGLRRLAQRRRAASSGHKIEALICRTTRYKVPIAEQLYSQYVPRAWSPFMGWGTGDTEALRSRVTDDKMPFMSASYAEMLTDPTETPYNFVLGADLLRPDARRPRLHRRSRTSGRPRSPCFHHDTPVRHRPDGRRREVDRGQGARARLQGLPDAGRRHRLRRPAPAGQGAGREVRRDPERVQPGRAGRQEHRRPRARHEDRLPQLVHRRAVRQARRRTPPRAPDRIHAVRAGHVQRQGPATRRRRLPARARASTSTTKGLHYVQGWYTMDVDGEGIEKRSPTARGAHRREIKRRSRRCRPSTPAASSAPIKFTADVHAGMQGVEASTRSRAASSRSSTDPWTTERQCRTAEPPTRGPAAAAAVADRGTGAPRAQQHRGHLRRGDPGPARPVARGAEGRSSRCSAPTAPASRPRSRRSPGCCRPRTARSPTASIEFDGREHHRTATPPSIVRRGISQVMEGRRVFEHLTVQENLRRRRLHAARRLPGRTSTWSTSTSRGCASAAPADAGYLSGGEQQMLAIGRALMAKPRLLMLDEPSLGLAPLLVDEIFEIIQRLNPSSGTRSCWSSRTPGSRWGSPTTATSWRTAASCSTGPPRSCADNPDVQEFYLGLSEAGERRKSYRDVKHYKRRKRWL